MSDIDNQNPSAPQNLIVSNITDSSLDLSWSAATDNVGVTNYKLYSDGVYNQTINNGTSVNVSGLGSPVVTLGPVHPFCFSSCDGMIMATTSGGVPSYSGYS